MLVDWNISITGAHAGEPRVKTIEAVPGMYKVVFIICRTREEAETTKAQTEKALLYSVDSSTPLTYNADQAVRGMGV